MVKRRECSVQGKKHEDGIRSACLRYAKRYRNTDSEGNYNTKPETDMQQCDNRKNKGNPKNLCGNNEYGCFDNDDVETNMYCKILV